MGFTRDDVQALARLARLGLTAGEQDLLARQLAAIVEYARQVGSVDTRHADRPEAIAAAPLREDTVQPSLETNAVIGAAPDGDARTALIKVPRVLG